MAEKKVQPKSPQHEGVDPLTTGERLYPRTKTKIESEKKTKELNEAPRDTASDDKVAKTVADQEELAAKANTPNELLPSEDEASTDDTQSEATEPTPETETPKSKTTGSKTS